MLRPRYSDVYPPLFRPPDPPDQALGSGRIPGWCDKAQSWGHAPERLFVTRSIRARLRMAAEFDDDIRIKLVGPQVNLERGVGVEVLGLGDEIGPVDAVDRDADDLDLAGSKKSGRR